MNMKKKSLILFFALICAFFAFSAHAQIKGEDISLSINPKQPNANETVQATAASFSIDLNKTLISWSLNGQTVMQGVGQKTFSFKTGENGVQTVLGIKIDTTDGSSASKQLVINPASIDVLWEAVDSYVPPFYKGKALIPSEGIVKMVALLNSGKSSSASYNWKLDGKSKVDSSGYGKSAYVFKKSYLDKTNKIEVIVSGLLGESFGAGKSEIGNTNPKILFYKKDPTLGTIWTETLKNGFTVDSAGETIVVEPYFTSPKDLSSSNLKLNWQLGNADIATPIIKNELSIKPESKGGSSKIKVSIQDISKMFLNISKEINVNF
jgi:hypothetical protein